MPRVQEKIDQFVAGVVSAPSATDAPVDSAQYSLDVEPLDERGKLKGRKADTTEVSSVIVSSMAHIDSPDNERDVVYYNPSTLHLRVITDFYGTQTDTDLGAVACPLVSPTIEVENFSAHVGVGSLVSTYPRWVGYLEHEQFGEDSVGLSMEDARLLTPSALSDVYKIVADTENIYLIEWGGDRIYTWNIDDGEWVAPTSVRFNNIRSLALARGGSSWEVYNATASYLWIIADDDAGDTYLMKINRTSHHIVQRNKITTVIGADFAFADLIEVGSPYYLWMTTFVTDGVINASHSVGGETLQSGGLYKIATPTADGSIAPVLTRPYLGSAGASSTTGEWVSSGVGVDMLFHIGPQPLFRPNFSGNYVGVVCSIHPDDGTGLVDETFVANLVTGGSPSTNSDGMFALAMKYNTTDNNKTHWTSQTGVWKLEDASIDNSPLGDGNWDLAWGCTELYGQAGVEIVVATSAIDYSDTAGNLVAFEGWDDFYTTSTSWGLDATVAGDGQTACEVARPCLYREAGASNSQFDVYTSSIDENSVLAQVVRAIDDAWYTESLLTRGDIKITSESLGTGTLSGTARWYGASWLYDNYQEGPLNTMIVESDGDNEQGLTVYIYDAPARATHINIYRADSDQTGATEPNQYSRLLKSIKLDSTWSQEVDSFLGTAYVRKFNDTDNVGASYDALVGISETVDVFTPHYEISTVINSEHYVGRCYMELIDNASHYIFKSKPFRYDQFDLANDYLLLPETPVGMRGYNGRLYVWSANNMYRINPNGMYIEDTYEGYGIASHQSAVVTDFGMVFADKSNIYIHDGTHPRAIGDAIRTMQNSSAVGWSDMTHSSGVHVTYDPDNGRFMILTQKSTTGYAFIYTMALQRWDIWSISQPSGVLAGDDGKVYYSTGSALASIATSSTRKPFTYIGNISSLGDSTGSKKFRRFKFAYDGSLPATYEVYVNETQSGWSGTTLAYNSAVSGVGLRAYDVTQYLQGNLYYIRFVGHANGTTEIDSASMIASVRGVR